MLALKDNVFVGLEVRCSGFCAKFEVTPPHNHCLVSNKDVRKVYGISKSNILSAIKTLRVLSSCIVILDNLVGGLEKSLRAAAVVSLKNAFVSRKARDSCNSPWSTSSLNNIPQNSSLCTTHVLS
ncbi:putative transcription factor [Bufonid herpesvirus 1]|uniref:putative transcription factor n=1 Tax=Bufonid herpesvirus 1 TaxID=2282206 RepID=UPI000EB6CF2A|nr:putative transcription factor [Bufonid herpesvirus 1]AXF48522.1 putative transcription factor [Bufonid herpesvirus 1]